MSKLIIPLALVLVTSDPALAQPKGSYRPPSGVSPKPPVSVPKPPPFVPPNRIPPVYKPPVYYPPVYFPQYPKYVYPYPIFIPIGGGFWPIRW